MSLFKKIAKGVLIGAGTILSAVNPAIGAPLVVAGTKINTGGSTSDKVSEYSRNLVEAQDRVAGINAGSNIGAGVGAGVDRATAGFHTLMSLAQRYWYVLAIGLGFYYFNKKKR